MTRPGPLAFGLKPSTLSFSVGSDLQQEEHQIRKEKMLSDDERMKCERGYHRRSISTMDPTSMVIGLSSFSICSTEFIDLPMPPCMHIIFFSIRAARGRVLKS